MTLIQKLFGKDDTAFIKLDKIRAQVTQWQNQFARLNDHVTKIEAAVETARRAYFDAPSPETLNALTAATTEATNTRTVFSANAAVASVQMQAITERHEVREVLRIAFEIVQKKLTDLAAQHDTDEIARCAEAGIEFKGCLSAHELRRKSERCSDALNILADPESKPFWHLERVLESL